MSDEEIISILNFLNYKISLGQFRKIIPYINIMDMYIDKEWFTIKIFLVQSNKQITIKISDLERCNYD